MNEQDLIPCPFCGGDPKYHPSGFGYAEGVFCRCGCDFAGSPDEWNHRAAIFDADLQIAKLQAERAKLVEALRNRDGGAHDEDCKAYCYTMGSGLCNCGHDEVQALLAELGVLLAELGETKTSGYSAEKKALALFLAPELDAPDSDWGWEDDGLFQTALDRLQYLVDANDNLRRRLGEVDPTAFSVTAGEMK